MRKLPSTEGTRSLPLGIPVAASLLLAVFGASAQLQPWLWLAGAWLAIAATLRGLHLYRPSEKVSWYLILGMLSLWSSGRLVQLLQPEAAALGTALIFAGQSCVLGIVVRLTWIRRVQERQAAPSPAKQSFAAPAEASSQREPVYRYADLLLLTSVVALAVGQTVTTAQSLPAGLSVSAGVVPVVDVILVGFLVRFLLSRARLPRCTILGLLAAILIVISDVMAVIGYGAGNEQYELISRSAAVVAIWMFVWAPLEPTMGDAFTGVSLLRSRSESARLLALMPLAGVPILLYLMAQKGAGLPGVVYILICVLMAVVSLARGAAAVLHNEWLAERDWYTGLLNRRGLVAAMRDIEATPQRPWLLGMADIDDFKHVNDTFGHEAGDHLLVQVAQRLQTEVHGQAIVGHFGGDEFVLVLPPGHPCVESVLTRVFAAPFNVAGHELPMQASAGVTEIDGGDRDESALFTEVDIAMYAAKDDGKNRVAIYDPKQREQVLGRQTLIADLRRTLEGDATAGTFEVYYQPLVELGTGTVTGVEALIRWKHAERGLIRPDEFISLAETAGLAGQLDRWVLIESLQQVAAWEAEGIGSIYVSVNLGRTSMLDPQLAEATLEAMRVTGVRPEQLHLEITEHDELPREAGALTLALLTEAGVRVSLDDFGIGYTSLDYLHRYPVRQLKLDRSITSNLQTDPSSPLLEGIVALARSLQVDVVAEGIETEPQRARLAGLGIAFGQGYHLCRPQPADSMTALLREAGPARLIPIRHTDQGATVVNLPA